MLGLTFQNTGPKKYGRSNTSWTTRSPKRQEGKYAQEISIQDKLILGEYEAHGEILAHSDCETEFEKYRVQGE
jgi:hypothetical protein